MKTIFQLVYLYVFYTLTTIIDQCSALHGIHRTVQHLFPNKLQPAQLKHRAVAHDKAHQANPFGHINHNLHILSDHKIQSHHHPDHKHHHHPHIHNHHIGRRPQNQRIVPHIQPAHLSPQLVAHPIRAARRIAPKNQIHPHRLNPQHKPQFQQHKLQGLNPTFNPPADLDEVKAPTFYKRVRKYFTSPTPPPPPTTTITTNATKWHRNIRERPSTASKLLDYNYSEEHTNALKSLRAQRTISISSENETITSTKKKPVSQGLSLGESLSTSDESGSGSDESSEYYDSYYDQDVNRSTTKGWFFSTIDIPKLANLTSEEARIWNANSSYIVNKLYPPESLITIDNQTLETKVRNWFNPQEILPQYMPFYIWYYNLATDPERLERINNMTIHDTIDFHNLSQFTPFPIPSPNQRYYMFVDYVEHLMEREKEEELKEIDEERRWEDMLKHPQAGTYFPGITHDHWFDTKESQDDDDEVKSGDEDPYADQSFSVPGDSDDEDGYGDSDDDDDGYSEPIDLLAPKAATPRRRKGKHHDPIRSVEEKFVAAASASETEEISALEPVVTGKNKYRRGKERFTTTVKPV